MLRILGEGLTPLREAFDEQLQSFTAGDFIVERGQPAAGLYLLREGLVQEDDGEDVHTVQPTTIFGKTSIPRITGGLYDSTAIAQEDTVVSVIPQEALHQLFSEVPVTVFALDELVKGASMDDVNPQRKVETITPKELEVLQYYAEGLSAEEIAARSYGSPRTVEVHARNIRGKLGAGSTSQIVITGYNIGIVDGDQAVSGVVLPTKFSPRERDVLQTFTANGGVRATNGQIGETLFISPRTVEMHLISASDKFEGVKNRTHLGIAYLVAKHKGVLETTQ
ncbi:MAG TPA: LuxR C-terminal-related transcriptional regulator [Candidatus Saccharimonadales bacterium]|nr:LuxR C-terminal-related transcriptional regulator [Candidatus Saccharimonadales bacterium]